MVIFDLHFLFVLLLFVEWSPQDDLILESNLGPELTAAVELYVLMLDDVQALRL